MVRRAAGRHSGAELGSASAQRLQPSADPRAALDTSRGAGSRPARAGDPRPELGRLCERLAFIARVERSTEGCGTLRESVCERSDTTFAPARREPTLATHLTQRPRHRSGSRVMLPRAARPIPAVFGGDLRQSRHLGMTSSSPP